MKATPSQPSVDTALSEADSVRDLVESTKRKAQEELIAAGLDRKVKNDRTSANPKAVTNCGTCDT